MVEGKFFTTDLENAVSSDESAGAAAMQADKEEAVALAYENAEKQPEKTKQKRLLLALIIVFVIGILLAVLVYIGATGGSGESTFVASGFENARIDKAVNSKVKAEIDAAKKLKEKKNGSNNNGEGPDDNPEKDPNKDPNGNGENGNSGNNGNNNGNGNGNGGNNNGNNGNGSNGNGGNSQVWHPAWDEWVVSGYYETRYIEHPAVFKEVIHPAQGYYAAVCNTCGAILGPGEASWHLVNSENCESYKNNVWIQTSPAWIEYVVVTAAWTETIQVWIDTSHWVHHEGYWQ